MPAAVVSCPSNSKRSLHMCRSTRAFPQTEPVPDTHHPRRQHTRLSTACRAGFGGADCQPCLVGTWYASGTADAPRPNSTACANGKTTPDSRMTTSANCSGECGRGDGMTGASKGSAVPPQYLCVPHQPHLCVPSAHLNTSVWLLSLCLLKSHHADLVDRAPAACIDVATSLSCSLHARLWRCNLRPVRCWLLELRGACGAQLHPVPLRQNYGCCGQHVRGKLLR